MSEVAEKLTSKDFASDQEVRWCPGCGDYSILKQVQTNGASPEIMEGLHQLAGGKMPVFKGLGPELPAIRDYLGEIMQPIALKAGLIGGDAAKAMAMPTRVPTSWSSCHLTPMPPSIK